MSTGARPRTALITGGGRGIGLAIARRLLDDGYAVAVGDVNAKALARLDDVAAEHGDRFQRVELDITQRADVERAVSGIVERWGALDALVNNAGRNTSSDTFSTSEEDWDWVLDTNLKAVFLCSQVAAERMREQGAGAIVNISSTSAGGEGGNPAYSASKAGVIGLTRAMAHELGPLGIRVNAVAPGTTLSDWVQRHMPAEELAREAERNPLRRNAEPADIAAAVAFLASDDARHVTGQVLSVSGGRWMP